MPCGASATAITFVSWLMPPLETTYGTWFGIATTALADDMLTIDAADALLHHRARHRLAAEEHRLQVHREHAVEILFGEIEEIAGVRDAGVVDEHVDAAVPRERPRDDRVDVRLARDVAADELGAGDRRRGGRAGGLVAIGEHDRRALGGEALRAREADAARGAGDDGHAVLQAGVRCMTRSSAAMPHRHRRRAAQWLRVAARHGPLRGRSTTRSTIPDRAARRGAPRASSRAGCDTR